MLNVLAFIVGLFVLSVIVFYVMERITHGKREMVEKEGKYLIRIYRKDSSHYRGVIYRWWFYPVAYDKNLSPSEIGKFIDENLKHLQNK